MSLVQVVSKNLTTPGTGQTSAPISTTQHNVLAFCAVYKAVNAGVVTPSDSTGQTWIPAPGSPYSGGATGLTLAVWYAKDIAGNAANTFSLNTTGADTPTFFVAEFNGRDQFAPFNVSLTASDTVAASGAHTTGTFPATGGDDVLAFNVSSALSQTYAATGSWAIPPNGTVTTSSGYDAFVQYENNANQGANPNTYSVTAADKLDAFIISFKQPSLARSDEWLDYFDEVPEAYPIINAYQQWDYPPQILDIEADWSDETGDGDGWITVESFSGPVVANNVVAATAQYYGEDAELLDEALDPQQFAAGFQQSDNFSPAIIEEAWWGWDGDDLDDDEWTFRDESNVQNPSVVATLSQLFEESWEEEDADDFYADDFGNDDADPPQNDVWDHWPTDEDDYAVEDSYILLNNVGPTPITIEDGWDQEHFGTEDVDVQWTEDVYENDPNGLLNLEDAWGTAFDDTPELEDEYWWIENETDYQLVNNNPDLNTEDPWDHFPTEDDDYAVIDDYALVDVATVVAIAPEDPWVWDEEPDQFDGTTHDLSPVGANLVIAASQPPDDPTDWTQAEDDWFLPDDYLQVSVATSAQVPVEDSWDHFPTDDDDYAVIDDYQYVNNAPTVVADGWDHWLTDPDEEHFLVLDADPVTVPQFVAIEDPWDWTQDADDEEWIFRNVDAVIPLQGNVPEDAWDHFPTDDDHYAIPDDYALVTLVIAPSQITDDSWDHFYEFAEDQQPDFGIELAALVPSVYPVNPNFEVFISLRNWVAIWTPE